MTKKYNCPIPNCTYSWLEQKGWQQLFLSHLMFNHNPTEVKNYLVKAADKKQ